MKDSFWYGWIIGISVVIGIAAVLPFTDALYSVPPTQAWRTIEINNTATWPNSTQNTVTALNYRDTLYIVTDGSILLNVTSTP